MNYIQKISEYCREITDDQAREFYIKLKNKKEKGI